MTTLMAKGISFMGLAIPMPKRTISESGEM
jgi:hypothetical protein